MKRYTSETYTPISILGELESESKNFIKDFEVETIEELIDYHPNIPKGLLLPLEEVGVTFD